MCKELEQNMYSSSYLSYHQKYLTNVTEICFAMDFLSKYFDFCIIKTSGIIYLDLLSKKHNYLWIFGNEFLPLY